MEESCQMASENATHVQERAREVALRVHMALEDHLNGQTTTVVLVGASGVGKSTLVNTLIMKRECREEQRAKYVTANVEAHQVQLPLKQGKGSTTLMVYDSPGFTGDDEEDEQTTKDLQNTFKDKSVDLLLICFDATSDGCRYSELVHGTVLKKIVVAMSEEVVKQKGLLVLTKANKVEYSKRSQTDGEEKSLVDDFQDEHKRRSLKRREGLRFLADLEILLAGRLEFDANGRPSNITDVNGSKVWMGTLFNACGRKASVKLAALFYARLMYVRIDPRTPLAVVGNLPKLDPSVLRTVVLVAAGAVGGIALFLAGGALGMAIRVSLNEAAAALPAVVAALFNFWRRGF